jgi:hypothetical protein
MFGFGGRKKAEIALKVPPHRMNEVTSASASPLSVPVPAPPPPPAPAGVDGPDFSPLGERGTATWPACSGEAQMPPGCFDMLDDDNHNLWDASHQPRKGSGPGLSLVSVGARETPYPTEGMDEVPTCLDFGPADMSSWKTASDFGSFRTGPPGFEENFGGQPSGSGGGKGDPDPYMGGMMGMNHMAAMMGMPVMPPGSHGTAPFFSGSSKELEAQAAELDLRAAQLKQAALQAEMAAQQARSGVPSMAMTGMGMPGMGMPGMNGYGGMPMGMDMMGMHGMGPWSGIPDPNWMAAQAAQGMMAGAKGAGKQAKPKKASESSKAAKSASSTAAAGNQTTVMLRNIPNNYNREMVLELLDAEGFKGCYDFVYLPMDFHRMAGLGYAFVNLVDRDHAQRVKQHFEDFCTWTLASQKICKVSWGEPLQGLEAHIERYRNSPVMHEDVPDKYKPVLYEKGERVAFPAPTKKIRPPRVKKSGGPSGKGGADAAADGGDGGDFE